MRDRSTGAGWRLEVRWVSATAVGTLVAFAAFIGVFSVIGEPSDALFPFLAGGMALIFGAFQQRVVRRELGRGRGWAVATGAGFGLGIGLVVALGIGERTGFVHEVADGALAGAVGGAVLGSAQWLVLREVASNARWWVPASIVAWAVGAAVADGVAHFADGTDLLVGPVVAAAFTGVMLYALKPSDGTGQVEDESTPDPAGVAAR